MDRIPAAHLKRHRSSANPGADTGLSKNFPSGSFTGNIFTAIVLSAGERLVQNFGGDYQTLQEFMGLTH